MSYGERQRERKRFIDIETGKVRRDRQKQNERKIVRHGC